jgi:hypothetical protein
LWEVICPKDEDIILTSLNMLCCYNGTGKIELEFLLKKSVKTLILQLFKAGEFMKAFRVVSLWETILIFFVVAPFISINIKVFCHQQMHNLLTYKMLQFTIY